MRLIALFDIIGFYLFFGGVMENTNQRERLLIFIGVLVVLICELALFTITFVPRALAQNNLVMNLEEPIIYREKMKIEQLIGVFQETLAVDNLGTINLDYLTVKNNTYYIGLFQDIIFFVTPLEIDDLKEDIVYQTGIIIDQGSDNYELAISYYQRLVQINNEFIYDVDNLVQEVLESDNYIDKNNGLLLAKISDEYEINFVIERKYES